MRVPRAAGARGNLFVEGGGGFFFFGETGVSSSTSGFSRLLDRLESRPTGDTLVAALSSRDGDERIRRTTSKTAATGVSGGRSVRVIVVAAR